jgi:anti-sigma factor RsiW
MRPILEGTAEAAARAAAEAHFAACPECGRVWKVARESTCRDLAEFLHEYLEGDLAPEQRTVFERHLALCRECVVYLETYRSTIGLCRESAGAEKPPPLPDDLVAASLAARAKGGPASADGADLA